MQRRLRVAANFERGENFFGNFSKLPLAVFLSWGIFLPVAGDEPDDDKRDSKLNESSLKSRRAARVENENKKFSKKLLTKTETALK